MHTHKGAKMAMNNNLILWQQNRQLTRLLSVYWIRVVLGSTAIEWVRVLQRNKVATIIMMHCYIVLAILQLIDGYRYHRLEAL